MNISRRKMLGFTVGVLGLSAVQAFGAEKRAARPGAAAAGGEPWVDAATDGMAKSVNYVSKKSDVTKADLKIEKQGVKFEQQNCANCMLYTANGKKDGVEAGRCTLFPGKAVKAEAWCTSWAKKS